MNFRLFGTLVTASLISLGTQAMAHATLEQQEAAAGSTYKGVMRIGHGCDGEATLKVRIQVPEGVISVKPMPKAGWELETITGKYEQDYDYYGTLLSEGVREIVWTGELADAHYDEFVFRGTLAEGLPVDQVVYFPTVQECASAAERWIEIPADGQDPHELEGPAPGVLILAPSDHVH